LVSEEELDEEGGVWRGDNYYKVGSGPFGCSVSVYKEASRNESIITLDRMSVLIFKTRKECFSYISTTPVSNKE
jgi:hypothetical protein